MDLVLSRGTHTPHLDLKNVKAIRGTSSRERELHSCARCPPNERSKKDFAAYRKICKCADAGEHSFLALEVDSPMRAGVTLGCGEKERENRAGTNPPPATCVCTVAALSVFVVANILQ